MNAINWKYLLIGIGIVGSSYFTGWYMGRRSINPTTNIEYVIGNPITNTFDKLEPIKVDVPEIPWILEWRDTVWVTDTTYITIPVDSMSILKDYLTKRHYNINIFNIDTIGKCDIQATTYKNKLEILNYQFTPISKIITNKYSSSNLKLIGGLGLNTNSDMNIQFGLLNKYIGATYQYTRDFKSNNNYHGINLIYLIPIN